MFRNELNVKGMTYQTKDKQILIDSINALFVAGNLHVILGPNGSGKSTLLKTLCGIWTPTHGEVLWNNTSLSHCSRKEMSRIISFVPQTPSFHFDFTVSDMVAMGCYAHRCSIADELSIIEQSLIAVDAWHLKDRPLSQLSGGERQRVYIARSLATRAPILLLDEPTAHLDLKHQLEVWLLLKDLVSEGKVIVVATHDLWAAKRFSDTILIMKQGRKEAFGSYESIMTHQLVQNIFGLNLLEFDL